MLKENNKYIPMTKSEFVKVINSIEGYHKGIDNIPAVLKENFQESVFWLPSLEDVIVDILGESFNDEDDMIGNFIYELEFGDRWQPGYITVHNEDVKMQTAEDLYDYLVDGLEEII